MSDEPREKSIFERNALSTLPPWAKMFVALFVTLMLCVVAWATWIFYESEGVVNPRSLPAYLRGGGNTFGVQESPNEVHQDMSEILTDTSGVIAPQWDTEHAGKEEPIDSAAVARLYKGTVRDTVEEYSGDGDLDAIGRGESRFRRNLGLAHTHINGQTLLFFALGAVFLFSSAKAKIKRMVFWIFGPAIFGHAIGLTGRGYHWFFDDLLAVCGMAILACIVYMAIIIYVDLGKKAAQ